MAYTLEDLEKAKKDLERWREAFADDRSNNPNKYRSQIKNASAMIRLITADLKERGVVKLTEEEQLQKELDHLHPNAKSRSIVKYKGKRYQIRYFPQQISNSGKTVMEWGHSWNCLGK